MKNKFGMPEDYCQCSECGFDHAYEATKSYNTHLNIMANRIKDKCVSFVKSAKAIAVNKIAIEKEVRKEIRSSSAIINQTFLLSAAMILIKAEGIEVRDANRSSMC